MNRTASGPASGPEVAKRYHRLKLTVSLLSTGLGWAYLLTLVLTPLAGWLVEVTDISLLAGSAAAYAHFLLFGLAAGLFARLFSLPLSFYSGYMVEHRYGLSNQTAAAWGWERFKGLLLGIVIGLPLLLLFYASLRAFGAGWWLPVGIIMFLFSVVLGRLAPTLILPLFYKFEPLAADNRGLRANIQRLCSSVGLSVRGVYRFNLSKTTRKANAAFAGLGRSRRVLLADTLLDHFPDDEIEAVVAHELGHYRLRHPWKMMAFGTVLTFAGMFMIAHLHAAISSGEIASLVTLPWLALFFSLYGFMTGPLTNAFSRRNEFAADRYASMMIGEGASLAGGLERLAEMNLADREPHPVVEFLFHSHPSINRRLAALARVDSPAIGGLTDAGSNDML